MVDDSLSIIEDQRLSLDDFSGKPDELIAMLQVCQNRHGYISEEDVRQIALFIKISETHIYGVASFYAQFRFQKPGEKLIQVCMGTACHVQGGAQLTQEIQKQMGISPGQTTSDSRFDFQEIACLGCCAQAPVVEIDGKIYGKMTPEELRKVLHEEL
ncbi:MAG: NADH-quinone oxidoreductase subunit NuoE [Anaerolineaceae bacterium]|jgi:NADH-quinone oxidoreductase subunit E